MSLAAGMITAAGSIIGGLISNQNSRSNADHAMDRQMEARRTAHQDEVNDLRAAGLNPVLSAGGSGASTPTMSPGESSDFSGAVGSGVNTALAAKFQKEQMKGIEFDNKLKGQQYSINSQDWTKKFFEGKLLKTQEEQTRTNIEFQELKNRYMRETFEAQIKEAKARGDWAEVNQLLGAIGGSASAIKTFIP